MVSIYDVSRETCFSANKKVIHESMSCLQQYIVKQTTPYNQQKLHRKNSAKQISDSFLFVIRNMFHVKHIKTCVKPEVSVFFAINFKKLMR